MYYCEQDGAVSKIYTLPPVKEAEGQDDIYPVINSDRLILDQTLDYYAGCLSIRSNRYFCYHKC